MTGVRVRSSIFSLASEAPVHELAGTTMLEAAKARTKMTKMLLKVVTLKGLIDRKVGTNAINGPLSDMIGKVIAPLKLWVEEDQIRFRFYSKEMSNKYVIPF